jgi:hypothetical protein
LQAELAVHAGMHALLPYGQVQDRDGPQTMVPPSAWHSLSELHGVIERQTPHGVSPPGETQAPSFSQSRSHRHWLTPREREFPASLRPEEPPAPQLPESPVVWVPPVATASCALPAGPASWGVLIPKPFPPQELTRKSPTNNGREEAIGGKDSATSTPCLIYHRRLTLSCSSMLASLGHHPEVHDLQAQLPRTDY